MTWQKKRQETCPYCFHSFVYETLDYRCGALPQVCPPEVDATYNAFFDVPATTLHGKITPAVPAKMKGFGKQTGRVKCQGCATETSQRICSKCHGNLPKQLATGPHFPLAIVAADPAESTRYIARLIHQLMRIVAHDLGAQVEVLEDIQGFSLMFEKKVLGNADSLTLSFHCIGPEDLNDEKSLQFLRSTKGVIFLQDGASLFQEMAPEPPTFQQALQKVLAAFSGMPLALGFTHMENWSALLPKGSILNAYPHHGAGYDALDGQAVSQELFAYMGAVFGANLLRHVRAEMPVSRCFGLSLEKNAQNSLREDARVEDVLLWFLKTWKVL